MWMQKKFVSDFSGQSDFLAEYLKNKTKQKQKNKNENKNIKNKK